MYDLVTMLETFCWTRKQRIKRIIRNNLRLRIWILGLYSVTFTVVLPLVCSDWSYSVYYMSSASRSELEQKAMKVNARHATKAKDYLWHLNPSDAKELNKGKQGIDLAIGIVTVPRKIRAQKLEYLTQTFVKLYQNIQQDSGSKFHKMLLVCNVFAGPGNHTEAQSLSSFVRVSERFPVNDPGAVIMDRFNKEKDDYAYCIDELLKFQPQYVLIVEDDALPYPNIFEVLKTILHHLKNDPLDGRALRRTKDWAYLKLYYPERWKGYSFEVIPLIELTGLGLIGGTVFVFCGFLFRRSTHSSTFVQFSSGFLYFVLVAVMIGRPYLIEWRRITKYTYTLVPAPDCCSPTILYAADKAKQLSDHLKMLRCSATFPLDAAIDNFSRSKRYNKYLIEPNLVQHIGMLSSIKTFSEHPQEFIHRPEYS